MPIQKVSPPGSSTDHNSLFLLQGSKLHVLFFVLQSKRTNLKELRKASVNRDRYIKYVGSPHTEKEKGK